MSQVTNTAPWHNTGHAITSDRKGFQIPQELNFEIEARPIYTEHNGNFVPMAKNRVLTRTDTNQALGIIGTSYHPYTNPQMWDIVSQYCKQTGGTLDKAGQYNSGEFVWAVVRHDDYEIVSGDPPSRSMTCLSIRLLTGGRSRLSIPTFASYAEMLCPPPWQTMTACTASAIVVQSLTVFKSPPKLRQLRCLYVPTMWNFSRPLQRFV